MAVSLRTPAVAGRFYPGNPDQLLRDVRTCLFDGKGSHQPEPISAIGCVAPHAGYIYSGGVAGAVYSRLKVPERCIVLCPNHTGKGGPLAIMANTAWQTPLGEVEPDPELSSRVMERFPALQEDSAAHRSEHAIEVQLPFLQVRQPRLNIVSIAIGTSNFDVLRGLGEAVAEAIGFCGQPKTNFLIVASSDMNHYESDTITRIKDQKAIERVLAMDARGLWKVVMEEDISMCGYGPTIVMLTAAKLLGAGSTNLVKYATSGEVSGDFEAVVGYAGIVVS